MVLSPAELAVLGTLGGAFIGGFSSTVVTFINKRSEERKHFRELVVNTAIENWKHVSKVSVNPILPPLTDYIIHTMKICELALNKDITAENIKPKLDEISKLMDILYDNAIKAAHEK